ncbi:N-(5'-phosphoribosyl)anthranilate isomerase [Clostridium gelidum]|uniref:N-(5'-phosphoribosyl)anthranilate isomerase n=1 Tax=Clostridium gelidum TaxID=704125 RepID=A0ABM7T6K2_9CLOT|nr:phosphoribosylanthranilate isomerase [Clostridium gelidum]BCZ46533.1 N-(5'-phosphoribosyl)anthranilate isomerase [Clostridium gelidum]
MIQVKICGITNKKEIEYLNILKPEYIGFVFAKSKRQVTGEKAKELCSNLDENIKKVGVFKDNSIDEILDVLGNVDLDVIQLHGKEDEDFINLLKKNMNKSIKIWKAISIKDIKSMKKYIARNKQSVGNEKQGDYLIDNFLIDGDNPGSGEAFSLENINEYFGEDYETGYVNDCIFKQSNFFLAGGISAENVIERIAKANPSGVDVSSGVEIIDGDGNRTKSFEKMKSLIEKVRTIK